MMCRLTFGLMALVLACSTPALADVHLSGTLSGSFDYSGEDVYVDLADAVTVTSYGAGGNLTETGWIHIRAQNIYVFGTIDARGRGYGGGGGGSGAHGCRQAGSGGSTGSSTLGGQAGWNAWVAHGGPGGAGGGYGGGGGGTGGSWADYGSTGGAGTAGGGNGARGSGDDSSYTGYPHSGGGGGGGSGDGSPAEDGQVFYGGGGAAGGGDGGDGGLDGRAHWDGGGGGGGGGGPFGGAAGAGGAYGHEDGFPGSPGGYLGPGCNGDTTTDLSVVMGSGGGGGGGGNEHWGYGAAGGQPGGNYVVDLCIGGGGGGGGGGAGGGAIVLEAEQSLVVSGQLLADGLGRADLNAGYGAGGGIALQGEVIDLTGSLIRTRGGFSDGVGTTTNGGTVKLFYGTLIGAVPEQNAGRVFASLSGPTSYSCDFDPYIHGYHFLNWESASLLSHCAGMSMMSLAYYCAEHEAPPDETHPCCCGGLWWQITATQLIHAYESLPLQWKLSSTPHSELLPVELDTIKWRLLNNQASALVLQRLPDVTGGAEYHMVVAYALEEDASSARIYVYDPDFPASEDGSRVSYIDVDKDTWGAKLFNQTVGQQPIGSIYGPFAWYAWWSWEPALPAGVTILASCPVDIVVTDPNGTTISKEQPDPTGVSYCEGDLDWDGETEDAIVIEFPAHGSYDICVTPQPSAAQDSAFSLLVLGPSTELSLAIEQPVSHLPGCYTILLDETGVSYDEAAFEPPVTNADFALKDGTTVPIKFHLLDCLGDAIAEQRNVSLEVTGPYATGAEVTYVFSLSDGTLKYDDTVSPPHYIANFSTKTCSVMDGGHYTAEVKEDGAPIGSVAFDVSTSSGTGRGNKPQ